MGLLAESLFKATVRSMLPPSRIEVTLALRPSCANGATDILPVDGSYRTAWSHPSPGVVGPVLHPHQFSVAVTAPAPVPPGSPTANPLAPPIDVFPKIRLSVSCNKLPEAAVSGPTKMAPPAVVA